MPNERQIYLTYMWQKHYEECIFYLFVLFQKMSNAKCGGFFSYCFWPFCGSLLHGQFFPFSFFFFLLTKKKLGLTHRQCEKKSPYISFYIKLNILQLCGLLSIISCQYHTSMANLLSIFNLQVIYDGSLSFNNITNALDQCVVKLLIQRTMDK